MRLILFRLPDSVDKKELAMLKVSKHILYSEKSNTMRQSTQDEGLPKEQLTKASLHLSSRILEHAALLVCW